MTITLALLAMGNPCAVAERTSGVDERLCHARWAEQTDRLMTAQWRAALAAARREDAEARRDRANRPPMVPNLLASQRAWLRYRDVQCAMVSDQAAGGTGYGDMDSLCRINLNRHRAADLRQRATGFLQPQVP